MPRPVRIEFENAWYHVMNRGAGRKVIFPSDDAHTLFLALLADTVNEFQIEVHAYCLMSNHFHLLVKTPYANLNLAMQKLTSVYTRRHNRISKTDGPLFRGRYKAILIAQEDYLSHVSRYIHLNPVDANLVQKAVSYRWSSFEAYLDATKKPDWLQTSQMIRMVSPRNRSEEYASFVENDCLPSMQEFYNSKRLPGVLGSKEVRQMFAGQARFQTQWEPKNRLKMPKIVAAVSKSFDVEREQVLIAVRGRLNIPRAAAMYLAQGVGAYRVQEIAAEFGVSGSTVTQTIFRLKRILKEDEQVTKKITALRQVLVRA